MGIGCVLGDLNEQVGDRSSMGITDGFGNLMRRTEEEVRVGKFKNRKAAGQGEVTGEMVKGGRLGSMIFKSGVVLKD